MIHVRHYEAAKHRGGEDRTQRDRFHLFKFQQRPLLSTPLSWNKENKSPIKTALCPKSPPRHIRKRKKGNYGRNHFLLFIHDPAVSRFLACVR